MYHISDFKNEETLWNIKLNLSSANTTKWPNTLKQFVGNSRRIVWVCLIIFWGLALKGLKYPRSNKMIIFAMHSNKIYLSSTPLKRELLHFYYWWHLIRVSLLLVTKQRTLEPQKIHRNQKRNLSKYFKWNSPSVMFTCSCSLFFPTSPNGNVWV